MTRPYATQWRDEEIIKLFLQRKTPKEIFMLMTPEVTSVRIVYRVIQRFHTEQPRQSLTLPDMDATSKPV